MPGFITKYLNRIIFEMFLFHGEIPQTDFFSIGIRSAYHHLSKNYRKNIEKVGLNTYLAPLLAGLYKAGANPGRILDLCCGTGEAVGIIMDKFNGAEIVGLDISSKMILQARNGLRFGDSPPEFIGRGKSAKFVVADARSIPFPDNYFDMVVTMNAPFFFRETLRVMKHGGWLIIAWSLAGDAIQRKNRIISVLGKAGFGNVSVGRVLDGIYVACQKAFFDYFCNGSPWQDDPDDRVTIRGA